MEPPDMDKVTINRCDETPIILQSSFFTINDIPFCLINNHLKRSRRTKKEIRKSKSDISSQSSSDEKSESASRPSRTMKDIFEPVRKILQNHTNRETSTPYPLTTKKCLDMCSSKNAKNTASD